MKFLFLIGTEGTGHHMIEALLGPLTIKDLTHINAFSPSLKNKLIYRCPELLNSIAKLSGQTLNNSYVRSFTDIQRETKNIITHIKKHKEITYPVNLFEPLISFPHNYPRDSIRRPDILEFDNIVTKLMDIRYLILYRNPIATTYSGYRREFTNNLLYQAKIVEDNLIYIKSQFSQINPDKYRILIFEDFLENPKAYINDIATWWELDKAKIMEGVKSLKKPHSTKDIPKNDKQLLEYFFTEQRINQWKAFYYDENRIMKKDNSYS